MCSAGKEKNAQWEPPPAQGDRRGWELQGIGRARSQVMQGSRRPRVPGGLGGMGARGIMIHPMLRARRGSGSRRAHRGLVEREQWAGWPGPADCCVAAGRPVPARHGRLRWTACPPLQGRGGHKRDIDDTLIGASWSGAWAEGVGCRSSRRSASTPTPRDG